MEGAYALHKEVETFRLVIGNNTPTVHPVIGTYPAKGCIPLPVLDSTRNPGTITTNAGTPKAVVGTGTLFVNYYTPGDFLADANGVCRKIIDVISDTQMTIEAGFPTPLSNATPNRVKPLYYAVEAKNTTASTAAVLQEQTFVAGDTFQNNGAPVSYDVSTASTQISFTLHV